MVPLLLAATAASLSAPTLVGGPGDYPQAALRDEKSAAALVKVVVDPKGITVRCDTVTTAGDPELANFVCKMLSRRLQRPAKLPDGKSTWGVSNHLYKFYIPQSPEGDRIGAMTEPPQGQLEVSRLPDGARRKIVDLVIAVDQAGAVTDCGPGKDERQMTLVQAVCANRAPLAREPVMDASGEPVSYVTDLKIELVVPTTSRP